MTTVVAALAGGAIVLAIGLLGSMLAARRSAALRHALLAAFMMTAAAMPVFELALPQIAFIPLVQPATVVSPGGTLSSSTSADRSMAFAASDSPAAISGLAVFVALWVAGGAIMLSAFVTSLVRLARVRRACTPVQGRLQAIAGEIIERCGPRRHVTLLESRDPSLLITCGIFRPAIILPSASSGWTDDRLRIVLLHEIAHVRRGDTLIQIAGELLRITQWLNPLVWMACRRLREQSEYACDDAVLREGVGATEYASQLLGVARQLSRPAPAWAIASAIAHPSTLERRIAAMLGQKNRSALGRPGWIAISIGAIAIGASLAATTVMSVEPVFLELPEKITVAAQPAGTPAAAPGPAASEPSASGHSKPVQPVPGSIEGRIVDQQGGTMPGVEITLIDTATGAKLTTRTNAEGRFVFASVPPGTYDLAGRLPGFTSISGSITIRGGEAFKPSFAMGVGTLHETISVSCSAPAWTFSPASHVKEPPPARSVRVATRALWSGGWSHVTGAAGWLRRSNLVPIVFAQERPQAPVRVGGSVRAPRKLKDVKPLCPADMPVGEFAIQLTARIDREGAIQKVALGPSTPQPPAALVEAAMTAVRQWIFSPTLLNGVPIDVDLAVRIVFTKK